MGKDLKGKELGKGIVQKKTGRYEARFTNRFGKRVTILGDNLREVKKKLNEAIYEDEKEINIRENIKLKDWYVKWMNLYKFDTIRSNSRRHYNQVYQKHIHPVLGNFYLQKVTQTHIREILKKLKKRGYQFETLNKVRLILLDMFNVAMNDEMVKRNPAKGITIKCDEEKEIRVLSLDDQIEFFDCCKGTFYDNFYIVAIQTGMRIGELAALRWSDIDWDKKVINITRTLVYQKYDEDEKKIFHFEMPKTKSSIRSIPINKKCEIALKKQYIQKKIIAMKAPLTKQPEKEFRDLLFTTKYNTPLNSQIMADAISRIVKEMNLMRVPIDELETFSCHCFRHTFATRCFEAGIKPKTVQAYLGHATLQMTMDLYTSVLPKHMTDEMGKLDETFEIIEGVEFEYNMIEQKYNDFNLRESKVVNLRDYA